MPPLSLPSRLWLPPSLLQLPRPRLRLSLRLHLSLHSSPLLYLSPHRPPSRRLLSSPRLHLNPHLSRLRAPAALPRAYRSAV